MEAPRTHLAVDELDSITQTLNAKFPERDRDEVRGVVDEAYQYLAARARIVAHLIPLTAHRAREVLARAAAPVG
ncbi:three-helix bundle dimerization domain-containing protein [Smaragdicoccus niigatensis]|uniref:three-helix bundle dimerization domain-containing protein n=1 Tax=Smaragdicoccus niigatensis TaxID=359359 RepID=UPI00036FC39C|nr:hypothetical protein [Smaragdicoccus niigatensis]